MCIRDRNKRGALGRFVAETNSWIKVFRRAIKVSVGTGWTVQPDRGIFVFYMGKKHQDFYQ